MAQLVTKIFGNKKERQVKSYEPIVSEINAHFDQFKADLTLEKLPEQTTRLKERLANGETLDDVLPEAFALVKAACHLLIGEKWEVAGNQIVWDMVPYDVQLIGGMVLQDGKIAEMATGEGKTLVATMPVYLNALSGKGVHLVTVNDYLALRDSQWMGGVFKALGMTIGCIISDMTPDQRREQYACDITYGTNNEFGFDYLRDNMATRKEDVVQRGHNYAIVDEVDSVLIDEARTPLIISGPVRQSKMLYDELKPAVEALVRAQRNMVNDLVKQAEQILADEDREEGHYEAGKYLLQAYRGYSKHKKLTKVLSESGTKSLMRQVENDYIRDKILHELDESMYYIIDEKQHAIDLTEKGREILAKSGSGDKELFLLPDLTEELHEIEIREDLTEDEKRLEKDKMHSLHSERSERIHNISQLLRAYSLYEKDVEYVVQDGKVLIVDEFTGRLMPGRRYSDGLHQSIEAKEGVKVEGETQTVATITLQNYFRLYDKLSGMTGTAETEEGEFWGIYKLEVVVIPTNEPIRRTDFDDLIYKTRREKLNAIIEKIKELNEEGTPVLVGTVSVEMSETLSRMLRRQAIKHNVLNAKNHKGEAEIVKYAGQSGAVTIATNMAGRGTDIKLGQGVIKWDGEPGDKANASGGLYILGTERHESRRIDRQLRGRAGRQGDPGASIFFLSLEDDLMRLFAPERIASVMDRLGVREGDVISHPMVTKSIERAQKRVEGYNFGIRKHLLEYDDVMNQQREVIYTRRKAMLFGEDIRKVIEEICQDFLEQLMEQYATPGQAPDVWTQEDLLAQLLRILKLGAPSEEDWRTISTADDWFEYYLKMAMEAFDDRASLYSENSFYNFVRWVVLRSVDERWKDHLYEMDRLKEGVGLRAYGQKDPLIEYKKEGFDLFAAMLDATNEESLRIIFNAVIEEPKERVAQPSARLSYIHADATRPTAADAAMAQSGSKSSGQPAAGKQQPIQVDKKTSRNDPCPCGSGKKYKHCHGA
ncbi:preprotein translocase subunit SecA [Calditrichota bacterium]